MIRYLIIDDEPIAHDIIKDYCDLLPNLQLVKNCYDAIEALEYLNQHAIDLIFLDLNMPKLKGFEFLKTLSNAPKTIVTTAYKEHALEGYELNVVDYLLKPFSFERFLTAINKVVNTPLTKATVPSKNSGPNSLFFRSNKKYVQINLGEILYIEAAGNYTKIITVSDTLIVRERFSELLLSLDYEDIIQIHKSFAVSKKRINSIEGNRIFIGKSTVPIGKTYKMNISSLLR